jgi:virginiamycin B lyase
MDMSLKTSVRSLWRIGAAIVLAGGLLLSLGWTIARSDSPTPQIVYTFPPDSYPSALLVDDGQNLWLTLTSANSLVRFNSAMEPDTIPLNSPAKQPYDLTLGPDQGVWFTERSANQIGWTPGYSGVSGSSTEVVEYPLPSLEEGDPTQIIRGQDGRLWFNEFSHNRIGWIKPGGESGLIDLPAANSRPFGLAVDMQGNLWFTEWNNSRLGKISPDNVLSEIDLPHSLAYSSGSILLDSLAHPAEIILGPDGALWFTYENVANVGRLDLATEEVRVFNLATASSALSDLVIGADGRIWFIGFQTVGSFLATEDGPEDLQELPLDDPIFESEGRSQILQGPGEQIYFIKADAQNLYSVDVGAMSLRDLQVYLKSLPPVLLAGGRFEMIVRIYNASQAAATGLQIHIEMPPDITFASASPVDGDCAASGTEVICPLADLPGNETTEITVIMATPNASNRELDLTLGAWVSADQEDYLPSNNRVQQDIWVFDRITYFNDFSRGADLAWSHQNITNPDGQNNHLGAFANDNVTLTFTGLPPHDETNFCFDLYILGGWDGVQFLAPEGNLHPSTVIGPDLWANYLNDEPLLVTTFSNIQAFSQSYPANYREAEFAAGYGADEFGDFNGDGQADDARYRLCSLEKHSDPTLQITFYGVGLDPDSGEHWALDNVSVSTYHHDAFRYVYLPLVMSKP